MDKTVLCYVRPWNENQFKAICDAAFPEHEIIYISDFPKHDSKFQANLTNLINSTKSLEFNTIFTETVVNDVIARCRLLRAISYSQAKRMVLACAQIIDEINHKYKFDHFVGLTVDSYVIDVIRIVALDNQKKYIGLIPYFINNYCRLTARGEYRKVREVNQEEITQAYKKLVLEKEAPAFLNHYNSDFELRLQWLKTVFRSQLRFIYMSLIRKVSDEHKLCYHYWSSQIVSNEPKTYVGNSVFDQYEPFNNRKKLCYIPLQYFPECTVDYWTQDIENIRYHSKILDVLHHLSSLGVGIYLKEHPNCIGTRPAGWYEQLKSISGVKLLHPQISSSTLIKNVDFTLVWTGTAGAESYLANTPVIHLGDPYYITNKPGFIRYNPKWEKLPDLSFELSKGDQMLFIKHLLEGGFLGEFYHDFDNRELRAATEQMTFLGNNIKFHLEESFE